MKMFGKKMRDGIRCPWCEQEAKMRYIRKQEKRTLKRINKRKENTQWRKDAS